MHLGKFVFAQIVEFIPRFEFDKCVVQQRLSRKEHKFVQPSIAIAGR